MKTAAFFYNALGQSISAARAGILILSLPIIPALYGLGWAHGAQQESDKKEHAITLALVAGFLAAFSPTIFHTSHKLLANMPAITLATLSWLIVAWPSKRCTVWQVAFSALILAFSYQIKLFTAMAVLPIVLTIFSRVWPEQRTAGVVRYLIFFSICLLLFLIVLLNASGWRWREGIEQLQGGAVAYALKHGGAPVEMQQSLWRKILLILFNGDRVTPWLALLGAALALWKRQMLITVVWFMGVGLNLLTYNPIWYHHISVLIPAQILLIAFLIVQTLNGSLSSPKLRTVVIFCTGAFFLFELAMVTVVPAAILKQRKAEFSLDGALLVEDLKQLTKPKDLILADDPYLVALADRNVPPELVDTSGVRMWTRSITCASLSKYLEQNEIRAVVYSNRFQMIDCQEELLLKIQKQFQLFKKYKGGFSLFVRSRPANPRS